jgi:hypothetical protein
MNTKLFEFGISYPVPKGFTPLKPQRLGVGTAKAARPGIATRLLSREGTMARPRKHTEPLVAPYSLKLTASEAKELDAKIEQSGMSNAEFLRDVVLKNRTEVIAKPRASLEKKRMQFLFNKTSNNMNQIAHVLNGAQLAGKLSTPLCANAITQLEAIAKYLRSALNHVD